LGIKIITRVYVIAFLSVSSGYAQMSDKVLEINPIEATTVQEEQHNEKETVDRSVFYNNVVFNFEGSIVPKESENGLNQIAAELRKDSEIKVRIKGHTCNQGSDQVNMHYSKQKAITIRDYLLSKGVKDDQMLIETIMDKEPLVPNDSEENRRINRRVEIELIN